MRQSTRSQRSFAVLVVSLVMAIAQGACGGSGPNGLGGLGGSGSGAGGTFGGVGTGGTVGGNPPGAFALVSPLDGSSAQALTPTLTWDPSSAAAAYVVEIATTPSFGAADVVTRTVSAPGTDFTVAAATLTAGVVYYWQVSAVNSAGSTSSTGFARRFSSPYLVPGAHGIAATPDGTELVVASDVNSGPIKVIDLVAHAVTASISTGVASQPKAVAVSPDGTEALATLLTNGPGGVNGVAAIDLTSNSLIHNVADPCVATTLSDVAYFPDGVAAAIPDLSGGCGAMGLSTFLPTGTPSFQFVNFNDTNDPYGLAITPNGASVLVTMELDSRLYRVTMPNAVDFITLPSESAGVAVTPDGTKAVVAGADLYVVTMSTGSVATVPLSSDAPGGDFHNVAITPDGAEAVVVGTETIQIVSLASNTVIASYPATSGTSVAISADGFTAFVTDRGNGWVRVVEIP
jgi:DNA-binding beta-propeller fold protein YncE